MHNDAITGKFISKDPIGFGGGDTNLYRYVGNNSVNRKDPSGLAGNIEAGREALNIIAQKLMDKGYTAEEILNMMRGLEGSLEPLSPAEKTTMAEVILPLLGDAGLVTASAVGGYFVGDLINGIPVYGTNQTTSQWWSDYIWNLTHKKQDNGVCKQ